MRPVCSMTLARSHWDSAGLKTAGLVLQSLQVLTSLMRCKQSCPSCLLLSRLVGYAKNLVVALMVVLSACNCSISMRWFRGDNEVVMVEVTSVMALLGFWCMNRNDLRLLAFNQSSPSRYQDNCLWYLHTIPQQTCTFIPGHKAR